jgi:hypothetical protein
MPGGWSARLEEVIAGERTGYQPPQFRDRFWEDVQEGEALPTIVMPITVTRCVFMASASRDFVPQHHYREWARENMGVRDIFVGIHLAVGMLSRFLTDWGGPRSTVRRTKLDMHKNICPGDDMIITGSVTKKYTDTQEHRVDINILVSTQDGTAYVCSGTLALPSRSV